MSDLIKRLETVDELLRNGVTAWEHDAVRQHIREARQELQETTEQIRESQQAAIELLTELQELATDLHYRIPYFRITAVIGLLDGSAKEEPDEH